MRIRTPLTLLALLAIALASPAAAHHRSNHGDSTEEPPEEPCACDPVPPGPIDVVIGDWYECVGASSGWLVVDGGVARVSVHYCKPWLGNLP